MKLRHLLFSASVLVSMGTFAQGIPTHPMYVDFQVQGDTPSSTLSRDFADILDTWEPGKPFVKAENQEGYVDDNFFISRVRLKERFSNESTQALSGVTNSTDKNFCWWGAIGEMTKQWGPLPRYNFEADNFNMWQYLDIHGNWSNGWFRVPGAMTDVAHKNGVVTGCLYFIDWAASVTEDSYSGQPLAKLCAKDGSKFKYAKKFVQMLKYYGIDRVGINPEGTWSTTLNNNFQDFLAECHRIGREEENWPFAVDWYAFVNNNGNLSDGGSCMTSGHTNWFHKNGEIITDMYMLNYNWGDSQLSTSENNAKQFKYPGTDVTREYDVYAGFDQQGRGYGQPGNGWEVLGKYKTGICIWGAHDRNALHINSTDNGSSDEAIQTTYTKKQEMLFSGGNRNVINRPAVTTGPISASMADLGRFQGYANYVVAKSTLSELPFVTRFNLGNGPKFRKDGKVTFDHKWYNIGMQDYLPTWRWWIDNGTGVAPTDPIQMDFTFEDSWFAGSCLRVHGKTTRSDVHLYKTKFAMNSNCKISVTYKVENGSQPNMKLIASKEGSESVFNEVALPEGAQGVWKTVEFDASELGMDEGTMAVLGIRVENTDEKYSVLLGELSVIDSSSEYATVTPEIKHAELMSLQYNGVAGKIVFDMPFDGERPAEYEGCPVYNDEVGAWYYEIYLTQEGCEPMLVTTTTSWAAYFVEVPALNPTDKNFKIGVRAVAPDGKSGSDIVWSDDVTTELTVVNTVSINKPIIKPGETFVLGFDDPNHEADVLQIINSATDETVANVTDTKIEMSLDELGAYDVVVGKAPNATRIRGFFQITPEETGSLPQIGEITASKTEVKRNEAVSLGVGVTSKGEGTVSQALFINDPQRLSIPASVSSPSKPCTYAMWFKVDTKFQHASLGTNLMHKYNPNSTASWTEKEWGECWVSIRTKNYSNYNNADGELSASFFAPVAGTAGYEHNNQVDVITNGYSLTPDVWTHIAVTRNGNNLKIFLNGKEAVSGTIKGNMGWNDLNCPLYIGGSMANLSGLVGYVDEVQVWDIALTAEQVREAMEGYAAAPTNLKGYFDFEEVRDDNDGNKYFPNLGTDASITGAYLVTVEGEKTLTDVPKNPALTTGVPSIEGVKEIKYEGAKWELAGSAEGVASGENVTATYPEEGKYPVKVTVTNTWGSVSKTINDYIIVNAEVGINDEIIEDLSVYPNPFVDQVNVLFDKSGNYVVSVYNVSGQLVADRVCTVEDNEAVTLSFDAPEGMYLVKVTLGGKTVKTFKVNKIR